MARAKKATRKKVLTKKVGRKKAAKRRPREFSITPEESVAQVLPDVDASLDASQELQELVGAITAAERYVVFTDLHVHGATLDRALEVLRRVGSLAKSAKADIVCLGDFWHLRGSLNVRQLDAVQKCLEAWAELGLRATFIPGNHDQVTTTGQIHGVRMFDSFPMFRVATEPIILPKEGVAFLPWREDPDEQRDLFRDKRLNGLQVFAHAEAPDSIANNGKVMPGRFRFRADIRALYLGHFHKRQKLGENCWYVGSPFEMGMDERNDPHGVAIVEKGKVEPEFIDWNDFPKHHRLEFGKAWDYTYIKPHDIVEVRAAPAEIGSAAFGEAVAQLSASDVRPVAVKNEGPSSAPVVVTGLEDAIDTWVDDYHFGTEDEALPERILYLKQFGRELLKGVSGITRMAPYAPKVRVDSVSVTNFCAIAGTLDFKIEPGAMLIRGPMGSGKTSIADALTWVLFGQTTPRKAGSHTASLRADEVVHDHATECSGTVRIVCEGVEGPTTFEITRTKQRGKGTSIRIDPEPQLAGISDQQKLIEHVVGMDLHLWRACVYLGQGAVGTFVTDADKRRKELLSVAFGLTACGEAQKDARAQAKQAASRRVELGRLIEGDKRVVETLQETDLAKVASEWGAQRTARLEKLKNDGLALRGTLQECEKHLQQKGSWEQSKEQHTKHLDQLTEQLARVQPPEQAARLQAQMGALAAERSITERDFLQTQVSLQKAQSGAVICPMCQRPFEPAAGEKYLHDLRTKQQSCKDSMASFDVQMSNVAAQLESVSGQNVEQRAALEEALKEGNEALNKCAEGLKAFERIEQNKLDSQRRLEELREQYAAVEQEQNPFTEQQAQAAQKLKELQERILHSQTELETKYAIERDADFWDQGFGAKGLPVLVLRSAMQELESHANKFLAELLHGRVYCRLSMDDEDLKVVFYEYDPLTKMTHERRYEQLSGGQRRCVELAFNPFALSEMIFSRCGVRFGLLVIDELTTHLGQEEKPIICSILQKLNRASVVVIDHDLSVQSEFDTVLDVRRSPGQTELSKAV